MKRESKSVKVVPVNEELKASPKSSMNFISCCFSKIASCCRKAKKEIVDDGKVLTAVKSKFKNGSKSSGTQLHDQISKGEDKEDENNIIKQSYDDIDQDLSTKIKKNEVNEDGDAVDSAQVCRLCDREQPLYVYQQQEILKRTPERSLTKLLLRMKMDVKEKVMYLKYLRVSGKFCEPCECKNKRVHRYCQTAKIIIDQRVYCDRCGGQYNLFIKQERLCSSKMISVVLKCLLFIIVFSAIVACLLIFDGYLKSMYAR